MPTTARCRTLSLIIAFCAIAATSGQVAQAATSATGTQSVTADVGNTLEATFPGAYAWGSLVAGTGGNTSAEQVVNVKSNASWGARVSTDQVGGQMKEWTGAAYVAVTPKVLTNALAWRMSTLGGVGQGSSFAAFTSTPALVTGTQGVTTDAGVDVGLTFQQLVSYADVSAGANDYRVLVNYDVAQGY